MTNGRFAQARAEVKDAWVKWSEAGLELCDEGAKRALARLAKIAYLSREIRVAHDAWSSVHAELAKDLPADDPKVQAGLANIALAKMFLGDVRSARSILASLHRDLSDEAPLKLIVCENLGVAERSLGNLYRARDLQEQVLAARSNLFPENDVRLQSARANLATTKVALGDYRGALAISEKVLVVFLDKLPPGDPRINAARTNVAVALSSLGDIEGAHALYEQAHRELCETVPAEDQHLQLTRLALANAKLRLRDFDGARRLLEQAIDILSETVPSTHRSLQYALVQLARTDAAQGNMEHALALLERVYATDSQSLPRDHPRLAMTRTFLAMARESSGDVSGAQQLMLEWTQSTRRLATSWPLAPRELGALAQSQSYSLSALVSLLGRCEAGPEQDLTAAALLTIEALRGVEVRAVRLRANARRQDASKVEELESLLRVTAEELSRVPASVRGVVEDASDVNEKLRKVVARKEELEGKLAQMAHGESPQDRGLPQILELASRLPERAVGISFLEYNHTAPTTEPERRVAAFLVERNGQATRCDVASSAAVQAAVERVRLVSRRGDQRAVRSLPGERPKTDDELELSLAALRRVLLDPVLKTMPAYANSLVLSLEDALQLVPLDALPLASGELVGDKFQLQFTISLGDLLEDPSIEVIDSPTLLAFGGIDYDESASAPSDRPNATLKFDRESARFTKLDGTAREVNRIVDSFTRVFDKSRCNVLLGHDASKHSLKILAADSTFLHLATHGFFAPESVRSTADPVDNPLSRFEFGSEDRVSGLSPLVLTGLALAGANLPPNELGRRDGIVTAEEIAQLDLSNCYLATLSACESSLGVRRAGQGFASLRAAMHAAGARFVLSTLWKVDDTAAMLMMADFYERLWKKEQDPHAALWAAKMAARKRGDAFRDWAGWVLSGR